VLGGFSAAAGGSDFALARYEPDGRLDASFGIGGTLTNHVPGMNGQIAALALQPDGRIVAAGFTRGTDGTDIAAARYEPDGHLDPSFGQGGIVTTDLGGSDEAAALTLQPDGKILVAGCTRCLSGTSRSALVRYSGDGSVDPTFGDHGTVVTDFPEQSDAASAISILPNGKILAAGFAALQGPGFGPDTDFSLVRFLPDGRPDPTFGQHGQVATDFGQRENDAASSLLTLADGKILAAGYAYVGSKTFALIRYRADGNIDQTFGANGMTTTDFGGGDGYAQGATASGLALQPDGKIVVVGVQRQQMDFALARYLPNGLPDLTFGDEGKVTTDFAHGDDAAYGVVLTPEGRILAAGTATRDGNPDFALASYTSAFLPGPLPEVLQPE
jgi:uncharacterized delta-60 repeat protein